MDIYIYIYFLLVHIYIYTGFGGHKITWAKGYEFTTCMEKRMAHYPSTPILLCVGLMHLMLFLLWVALPQPNLSRPDQLAEKMNNIKRYLFDRN